MDGRLALLRAYGSTCAGDEGWREWCQCDLFYIYRSM